mgnify:FL=1
MRANKFCLAQINIVKTPLFDDGWKNPHVIFVRELKKDCSCTAENQISNISQKVIQANNREAIVLNKSAAMDV